MSVPNQDIIITNIRQPYDKDHAFTRIHNEALFQAMTTLKGETLKLWLYLVKYKENYRIELSRTDCDKWGLKKTAYYTAKEKLIELHYLVPKEKGSNVYYFFEDLSEGEEAYKKLLDGKDVLKKEQTQTVLIPEISTRRVLNPGQNCPVLSTEKQYKTIYKNNMGTAPYPKVSKEEMSKIPGEWVIKDGVAINTFSQRKYRVE